MTRADCLEYLYREMSAQAVIFRDAFMAEMAFWEVEPMNVGEKNIGVIATCGTEIHVTLDKDGALRHAKRIIKACLVDRIERKGYLTTRAFKGDVLVAQFLGRLGFYRTTEVGDCVHYRIDKVKIK